jgi:hypothetical protein
MKRIIAAVALILGSASYGHVEQTNGKRIVLPNSRLLGCKSADCSRLWESRSSSDDTIYPRQVTVDIFGDDPCPLGLVAIYEKSVSLNDLKAAIDEQYGRWALPSGADSPMKLWRVEPKRFAIQLSVTKDRTREATSEEKYADAISHIVDQRKRSNIAEGGMGQVIYIAFTNVKCGTQGDR